MVILVKQIKKTCYFFTVLLILSGVSSSQKAFGLDSIHFESPEQDQTLITKKPDIKGTISVPYLKDTLSVSMDQTDMTAIVKLSDTGFSLIPFHPVPAGNHLIRVFFMDKNNQPHEKEIKFSTRHSDLFETASSTNTVSMVYSNVLKKMDDAKTRSISDWEFESNLSSESVIGQGPWKVSFNTNARYSDQENEMTAPLEKNFQLADYLLKGEMDAGETSFQAALGNVSVEGTQNTIGSISRRGATFGATSKQFFLHGFTLKSQQTFGLDDSEDIQTDNDDHLLGFSGGLNLFDEKLGIKTVYATGGEKASNASYNIWPEPGGNSGNVVGLEVKTDFFTNKLTTRIEMDWSDYDTDTSDTAGSKTDKAYTGQISGTLNFFNYDLLYEYIGADYKVPTAGLVQDRKGYTAKTGFNFNAQSLSFNLGQYKDNLDKDPSRARVETLQYGSTYNLNTFASCPISLGFLRSTQNSSLEPAGSSEIKNTTDTVFGSVSHINGALVVGLQPEYSQMNDETTPDYDTRSKTLTLFAGYNKERFSVSPSICANWFEDLNRNVDNDTVNCNLSFYINIINGLDIEGAGSYTVLNASDNSIDQDSFSGDLQLSYKWSEPVLGIISPMIALRASHDNSSDKVTDIGTKGTLFYLMLSGSLDLSF
ncbi:MAG: hypothetical protein KKE62_19235 [Proteobacteria bacterium]|nr:hypothetical protein [Pseudomonadota bacterium]MBU1390075.1 hypothetical protein [Pseudomonadota bacterium]MBU1544974.1 hypothetical protein [Pseudomonadota bacterium]MBU2482317.1 hypothetical protein [Pseudomonadota bacterium]